MLVKIKLPNGGELEAENDLTIAQIRELVAATGLANLGSSPAVETVGPGGQRQVAFADPQGSTKG